MLPDSLVPPRKRRNASLMGMYPQSAGSLPQQAAGDSSRPAPMQPVRPLVRAAVGSRRGSAY